jgi:uncharacterized FAD-dependent dehydrogenase
MTQHGDTYDTVIVGMGTAGLLAAYELGRLRPGTSILLVDAGPPLAERQPPALGQGEGFGGAGLYLGARLYLGPIGIPVPSPVSAPVGVRPLLQGEAYLPRVREVDALFALLGADASLRPEPPEPLAVAISRAADTGIDYITSYPSRVLPVEQRLLVLARLRELLAAQGAQLAFGTRATAVARQRDRFDLTLQPSQGSPGDTEQIRVAARALILASGRYGTEWLIQTAGELGADAVELPVAFGVRVEVPASVYAPLTEINPDPRLQRVLVDDAVIKTYATCPGGRVISIRRYGALVASGVPLPLAERTANTTTAILLQPGAAGERSRWSGGRGVAGALNQRHPDRLVVQRLEDVRARRATTAETLAANCVRPTCVDTTPGTLADAYPDAYWEAFEDFIARIERLAPGVSRGEMLVYGPAEERFWHVPTDERLQTAVPGLFVAGDAAGHSQGVIQAGVAGLLAGGGVAAYLDA